MGTRLRNLSRLVLIFVAMATALVALPLAGSAQGNSGAARACQQGNYADLLGSNGETFANPGQCARFATQGGIFATLIPMGHTVTLNSTLAGCNHLAFGYAASDGSGGEIDEKPYNCESSSTATYTVGPFPTSVIITVYLEDRSCGDTYDSNGNHARVAVTRTGYHVDITDSGGLCESNNDLDRYPTDTFRNLSVELIVNP